MNTIDQGLYTELVTIDPESHLWRWPYGHFDPSDIRAVSEQVRGIAYKVYRDQRSRPLGILLARLLWELGELTHGDDGTTLLEQFLLPQDAAGEPRSVNVRFSVETPWETTDVDPAALDAFLSVALAVGDGMPITTTYPEWEEVGKEPVGVATSRNLYLGWRDLRESGGRKLFEPKESEPEDLVFGFMDSGDTIRLVNVGQPMFGDLGDVRGFTPIYPPHALPYAKFPLAFERPDGSRFFLPGSEAGCEIRVAGYAFLEDPRAHLPLANSLESDGRPVIRIHLEYTPGWQFNTAGVYVWSQLSDEVRQKLVQRFVVLNG